MFVTNVMVSRWSPVFTADVSQPLLQPVCVLQRKPEIEDHNMRSFSHWAFLSKSLILDNTPIFDNRKYDIAIT